MMQRLLITGSSGLIGSGLRAALSVADVEVRQLDIAEVGAAHGDVRDRDRVRAAVDGCDGVIHLAAVSRVIWGEQEPERCRTTNVDGVRNVLDAAALAASKPWVISASSREIYGQPDELPATEDCPAAPVNIYGETKVAGERLVEAARRDGVHACTIRLSNVFGSALDHADRVVPAFARGAAAGEVLRVDGADHTFDFTCLADVVAGIIALTELLERESTPPPPIHFVTGVPTTLLQLATLAIQLAGSASTIRHAPPRDFDVARFYGSPERARQLLGWTPRTSLETGLMALIHAYRTAAPAAMEVTP